MVTITHAQRIASMARNQEATQSKQVWQRKYIRTHSNGVVETWMIDKNQVLHPDRQQYQKTQYTMKVIPTNVPLIGKKDGKRHTPQTVYYSFAQSFSGGPGSNRDGLGGFCTGHFFNTYQESYEKALAQLRKDGFKR